MISLVGLTGMLSLPFQWVSVDYMFLDVSDTYAMMTLLAPAGIMAFLSSTIAAKSC